MIIKNIIKIYTTTNDGFINVVTPKVTYRHEGPVCYPKSVLDWMKKNPNKCYETVGSYDD